MTNALHVNTHRKHTLGPEPKGFAGIVRKITDSIEAQVARVSLHGDPPVYDEKSFPWVQALTAEWRAIRSELDAVLAERDRLPNFQDILKEASAITKDDGWKTYWLAGVGMDCSDNRRQCPATARLLEQVPGLRTAFFSILAPGKHIPSHRGAYNGLLRLHLALKVPEPAEQCRIRIGDCMASWRESEALIFDDSFQHEVWNETDGERVVLFVDFARPLRQPWHWLNERLLDLGHLAPFMREAHQKQKRWMREFHAKR